MDRDERGRFAGSDPMAAAGRRDPLVAAWKSIQERNRKDVEQRLFGRQEEEVPPEPDVEGDGKMKFQGSLDQGARGSMPVAPRAGMNEVLREAAGALRAGAREVTIEVT